MNETTNEGRAIEMDGQGPACYHCGETRAQARAHGKYDGNRDAAGACDCREWWHAHMLSLGLTPARKRFEFRGNLMEVTR